MAPMTRHAVDDFVSDKIGMVTACGAADPSSEFPAAGKWVSAFGLCAIFQDHPPAASRALALQFARRVEMAFAEYGLACKYLRELVQRRPGRWSPYFQALYHFEAALGQLYSAYDGGRKSIGNQYFVSNDGSVLDRLNKVHGASKHTLAETDQPTWLTNTGIASADCEVTFVELEDQLRSYGAIANKITNQVPAGT